MAIEIDFLMMIPFSKASSLSQIRRMRSFAKKVLESYSFKESRLEFVNHGENTTFRVRTKSGQSYLLRIHRNDYHSPEAIQEELAWLDQLSRSELKVPKPVKSRTGETLINVSSELVSGSRNCSVFKWREGRTGGRLTPQNLFQVGQLLAQLQNLARKKKTKYRKYWTAEGLVGSNPRFGSIDHLSRVSLGDQKF